MLLFVTRCSTACIRSCLKIAFRCASPDHFISEVDFLIDFVNVMSISFSIKFVSLYTSQLSCSYSSISHHPSPLQSTLNSYGLHMEICSVVCTMHVWVENDPNSNSVFFYNFTATNKKGQLSLTNPRDACEKFARFR